ncbi:hypothetical protein GCM10020258_44360 [Sphingomonas yabuuchiae]
MFLGIDIGTSGVKAVVLDEHGAVVGQGTAALTVQRPHPLWSEQDPEAWWQATISAVRAIDPAVRRAVRGIGLAGQMHGATLLGADDQVLRPGILWNDGRSHAECAELEAKAPISTGWRATSPCRVLPPPSCYGCSIMSRKPSRRSAPCYCPRIMSGCG